MKLPERPPTQPKHIEERLKLAANGLQALALAIIVAVVLAPQLNASLDAPLWAEIGAGGLAGLVELFAFVLLGYIPVQEIN